jgi:hypothetical protein
MSRKRIVVMGFMASIPIAGVVWQHIHYIVGLLRLGHDVYYIEDSKRLPYQPVTFDTSIDYSYAANTLDTLARRFGFHEKWGFCARFIEGFPTAGLSFERMRELIRTADAVFNVCGTQEIHEDFFDCQNLIYLESDPGVEQIKIDNGDPDPVAYLGQHRALFTFGESIGTDVFPVPLHGYRWMPTRQPVVTDFWKTDAPPPDGAVFTSIANWNTSNRKDIVWRGEKYLWSKTLEFLKFIDAPRYAGETLELATLIKEQETRDLLASHGWRIGDSFSISVDFDAYIAYVRGSYGEFTVAKDQYVRLHTGWFSDRSACYLAAGRPVITQETGFTSHYGGTRGLFSFTTLEEIAEHTRAIRADYALHSKAAAEIAVEYFEATTVLASVLERAGV